MTGIRRRLSPTVVLLAVTALIFLTGVAGVADAATGGNFILGQANTADAKTSLSAPFGGAAMQLSNTSTAAGATALQLTVASGKPPLTVNSATRVANLNADKLDNLDSTALQKRVTGQCPLGWSIIAVNGDGTVSCSGKAANADTLDGYDSSSFVLGPGQVFQGKRAIGANSGGWLPVLITSTPALTVGYNCPADLA